MNVLNDYSSASKSFYGVVSANSKGSTYASTKGSFCVGAFNQSDVLSVIDNDPVDYGHLQGPYDVSLKILMPICRSVGIVFYKGKQVGSCTLICHNLAIIPCHCIEDLNIPDLKVMFDYVECPRAPFEKTVYSVECLAEYDQELDYAIISVKGEPGKKHGYLQIGPCSALDSNPVLLHYPLGKPLQASLHSFIQTNHESSLLSTYHDSDYGSSGGAYVRPSGTFAAMHLGSSRNQSTLNLERLALPIQTIITSSTAGFLAMFSSDPSTQDRAHSPRTSQNNLRFVKRSYIDLERFSKEMYCYDDGSYCLRIPSKNLPGIKLDSHQGKHSLWLKPYQGKPGSRFRDLSFIEIVDFAEKIIEEKEVLELFTLSNAQEKSPPVYRFTLNKKNLGKELSAKLRGIDRIGIEYGYQSQGNFWEFHFYPN